MLITAAAACGAPAAPKPELFAGAHRGICMLCSERAATCIHTQCGLHAHCLRCQAVNAEDQLRTGSCFMWRQRDARAENTARIDLSVVESSSVLFNHASSSV